MEPKRSTLDAALDGYRELAQLLAGSRQPELPDSTVTMAQMRVLMLLSTIGESPMSELAASLRITLSTLSGLVDRLVESGLVSRRTDENDRRHVIVSLTENGKSFLEYFQEVGVNHLRDLLERLSPADLETVTNTLELLINAARELSKENPT